MIACAAIIMEFITTNSRRVLFTLPCINLVTAVVGCATIRKYIHRTCTSNVKYSSRVQYFVQFIRSKEFIYLQSQPFFIKNKYFLIFVCVCVVCQNILQQVVINLDIFLKCVYFLKI